MVHAKTTVNYYAATIIRGVNILWFCQILRIFIDKIFVVKPPTMFVAVMNLKFRGWKYLWPCLDL